MKEKFLPIGTVVTLKNGTKKLMIVNCGIFPLGDTYNSGGKIEQKGEGYDYGACPYPEGLVSSDVIYCFNHENIDKIYYMGYETDEQKEFSTMILERFPSAKEKFAENIDEIEKMNTLPQEEK